MRAVPGGGTWLERILTRICDGHGAPEDLDLLYAVGESICPGAFPHAANSRLGLEAVPFLLYKMTTICLPALGVRAHPLGAHPLP